MSRKRPADPEKRRGTRTRARRSRSGSTELPWAALQQAWRAIGKRVPELREDLSCYASVQVDRARLAAARLAALAKHGFLLGIAAGSFCAIATWLLLAGIAGGVASALEGKVWLANLITGAGAFALLLGGLAVGSLLQRRRRMRRLRRRYERHEARDRAADAAVPQEEPHAGRS